MARATRPCSFVMSAISGQSGSDHVIVANPSPEQRIVLCAVIASLRSQTSQPAEASQPSRPPRCGEFHTTFTERSPLSTPKEIAHRFTSRIGADYDLSKDKFAIYVPKDYDPATPCGLLVFLCYKHSPETAPTLHEIFDKDHLIFAVTEEVPATPAGCIAISPRRRLQPLQALQNRSQPRLDHGRTSIAGTRDGIPRRFHRRHLPAANLFPRPSNRSSPTPAYTKS